MAMGATPGGILKSRSPRTREISAVERKGRVVACGTVRNGSGRGRYYDDPAIVLLLDGV